MPGLGRDWNGFEITVRPVGEYGFRCCECRYEGRFQSRQVQHIEEQDRLKCPRCGAVRQKQALEVRWRMGQVGQVCDDHLPVPDLSPERDELWRLIR